MNIHEYQAKELLAKFGVPVPAGHAAMSVDEAVAAAEKLPGPLYVVKAQIHAGGRGKGKFKELGPDAKGGVRLARTLDEVRAAPRRCSATRWSPSRPGPAGKQVNRLYVTDGVDIAKEFYLALLVDRKSGRIAFVVSTEGGMNIEEVAHDTPEKIRTFTIDPATGFMPHHGRAVASALGLNGDLAKQAQKVAKLLYDAFVGTDARRSRSTRWPSPTTASCWCSTPRSASIPTPISATRTSTRCATRARRIRWRSRPRSTTSPTSSSTAISAAWSTAPASPWRRWTSSS